MLRPALIMLLLASAAYAQSPDTSDWGYFGGDVFGQRYSSLAEIDRSNVGKLKVAWQFRTGDLGGQLAHGERFAFQATPILAFETLYLATPTNIVIALDPASGRERWRFDAHIDREAAYPQVSSRGVVAWESEEADGSKSCARRIFAGTLDGRVVALDAHNGHPCTDFGKDGSLNAAEDLPGRPGAVHAIISPPVTNGAMVAVAFASGTVRGFDALSGAPRWSVDTAPVRGAMTADPDRNLLFVPAGASLLALDGATGKVLWQRELVHQDLWHFELGAQPALIDFEPQGLARRSVLQATAQGMLFLFDRDSGAPVVPVVEQQVPAREGAGSPISRTQPFPTTPLLVPQQPLRAKDAWGLTFWDRARCRAQFKQYRNQGPYTPPEARGTVLWPADVGGVNWGGVSFDARRQRLLAAVNLLPSVVYSDGTRRTLVSPFGFPCTPPPWGALVSVDLRRNEIIWQVPLGSTAGLGPWFAPTRNFGTPGHGGPIATAGDVVFVGAAMDGYFRAFDLETGRELWKHLLPAGAQATPMTYRAGHSHRQFVVICAGGDATLGTPRGDYVIAFALDK